jgi:hypothetical protein
MTPTRLRHIFIVTASLLLALAVCPNARAQANEPRAGAAAGSSAKEPTPEEIETARAHFARGVQFYNNGDHKLALVEFKRSHELSGNYRVLYNIGQVNHQLGLYTKALAALDRYLSEGGSDVPEPRRTEVLNSIAELRKKTAHLKVRVNVDGAEIFVDDVSLGEVHGQRALTIDAGDHRIEARKNGYRNAGTVVTLAAGEVADVPLELVKSDPAIIVTRPSEPKKKKSPLIWVGWTATGVMAVGAAATGVLAMSAANELASLRESPDSTPEERDASAKRARRFAIASDALTGAAVLTGAVSLYFTLRGGSEMDSKSARSKSSTQVGLRPGGVSIVHRF